MSTNPYAPPVAEVSDAADDGVIEMAGRGTRLGAALVDGLIAGAAVLPVAITVGFNAAALRDGNMNFSAALGVGGAISAILYIALIIATIYLVNKNGQTIGKKLLGIKVVRTDGSRATLGRIFWLRNVVNTLPWLIPLVGGIYNLVDALMIFAERRKCVHDMIADTIVVKA